jgi:hypothetical protein
MKVCPKLTKIEKDIIQSRLEGLSFCQLSENDLRLATDQIMIRGAAMCGCALPNTEGFAEIISSELIIFINKFGYENLTLSEILLSMRLNLKGGLKYPTGLQVEYIPFSGHCFNVDYIAKILLSYSYFRNILNQKFTNHIDGY